MDQADHTPAGRTLQVAALGSAQLVGWASSIYLPAVIAQAAAVDLGTGAIMVFAAYSCALGVAALVAPAVGRAIDRKGGRTVLALSNLILAAGLIVLGFANSLAALFLAWAVIGLGIALGLYDAAFAALVRQHGVGARGAIIGITLLGGFASTVGWPLTAYWVAEHGWRNACLLWAALHLFVALPLNWFFIPKLPPPAPKSQEHAPPVEARDDDNRKLVLLSVFGAATAFVTSAMAAHLPALLLATGVGAAVAIAASSLVGVSQVAGRLAELALARFRPQPPLMMARIATSLHPLGVVGLLATGATPAAATLFAVLHGVGNGMITIAKGTLPLAMFGSAGYGARLGLLAIAHRLAQALAPFLFGLMLEAYGVTGGLLLSAGLSLLALAALAGLNQAKAR